MEKRFFATDCEGPVSKNDNAMELASHFIPEGDVFFARVSKYDDFLADVEKKPGYRAGDTLKLILPFLKAFGVTEKAMEVFSGDNILLLPSAQETLSFISSLMPSYIISTSYRPYIVALCRAIRHPEGRSFSTVVPLDRYLLNSEDERRLRDLAGEIAALPAFDWTEQATGREELAESDRWPIERMDRIFWKEVAQMGIGRLLFDIRPVGGEEKALALKKIAAELGIPLSRSFYVGDSITDVQAFQAVNQAGGLTLAFNGNAYAVREARLACLAPNTLPIAIMARAFYRDGNEGVLGLARDWSRQRLLQDRLNPSWIETLFPEGLAPQSSLIILDDTNRAAVGKQSSAYRKQVRGESIGALG
jgi:energy-converting hydrogenase A subunit R